MHIEDPITFKHRVNPVLHLPLRIFMLPHYHVFEKTTYRPIVRIIRSRTSEETHKHLREWCTRKNNEASYVQVAGAVLLASVVSCLGWDGIVQTHWVRPAAFYVCILLSLASIFTAAQQSIVLPDKDTADAYDAEQVQALRLCLLGPEVDEPSFTTLFAWQCPIMLMGYSVVFFGIGLCTFVISPLAFRPEWGPSAKTLVLFLVTIASIAVSASMTTRKVHKFRI